ncbi:hypothetical protein [Deinococcus multiflagellatus]|uniref:Uncharacterized protein n=1 Tax=Deinococcus multiflagellatus TaxID=1656887 RepID=A0ABW1ZR78_9DEIO
MTSGEILQAITLTSTLVIGVWTLWGKGKDTNYTRLEGNATAWTSGSPSWRRAAKRTARDWSAWRPNWTTSSACITR